MNIIIVDDDVLVAESLKIILDAEEDFNIQSVGHDGTDAVRLYNEYMPDVLLMDIRMENMNGLDAAKEILTKCPNANILLLTTFSDDEYIVKALQYGAKGYILKQDYANIVPAIRAVYAGQTVFGNEITSKLPTLINKKSAGFPYEDKGISSNEYSIIELISKGYNNKEIAETMFLSEGTVRNYISTILEKLELRDRTQIAVLYYSGLEKLS